MSSNIIFQDLKRIVPICFVLGAGMELFMIKTGFYTIVTRKEAERRLDLWRQEEGRKARLRALNLPSYVDPPSSGFDKEQ
ncbi:hypothetical protein EON65_41180 [archaeon]|nr:MAG: hypothetical protein EON65_41180 [archaeon]